MTETTALLGPGDEMRAMLTAGAEHQGYLNIRAAVHLLTFTDLPAWRGFPRLVDIERVACRDGQRRTVALLYDWAGLPLDTRAAQISGAGRRLLALAVALAAGGDVDLRDSLSGLGHAHARRVMEAVAIATGADEFYTLTGTPALAELEARRAELAGEAGR